LVKEQIQELVSSGQMTQEQARQYLSGEITNEEAEQAIAQNQQQAKMQGAGLQGAGQGLDPQMQAALQQQ